MMTMTMMKADTMVSTSSSPFGGGSSSSSSSSSGGGAMMDAVGTATRNRTLQKQPAQLSQDYTPGNWDVILQRGRECHEHIGNRRFKICVENHVDSYLNAKTRLDKTLVISSVVRSIAGGFIMRNPKTNQWYHVDNKVARDKAGNALRDAAKQRLESSNDPMTNMMTTVASSTIFEPSYRRQVSSSSFDDHDSATMATTTATRKRFLHQSDVDNKRSRVLPSPVRSGSSTFNNLDKTKGVEQPQPMAIPSSCFTSLESTFTTEEVVIDLFEQEDEIFSDMEM